MLSMVKSGCRRCAAKGSRPRNVSVPSRAQAGQTWCPEALRTVGSMHPRQYLQTYLRYALCKYPHESAKHPAYTDPLPHELYWLLLGWGEARSMAKLIPKAFRKSCIAPCPVPGA